MLDRSQWQYKGESTKVSEGALTGAIAGNKKLRGNDCVELFAVSYLCHKVFFVLE